MLILSAVLTTQKQLDYELPLFFLIVGRKWSEKMWTGAKAGVRRGEEAKKIEKYFKK